jgi:hypothetical protein
MEFPVHAGQGFPSLGQGGPLPLFLFLGRNKLLERLEKFLLGLEELILENGDLLPSSFGRMDETRLHLGGLLQVLQGSMRQYIHWQDEKLKITKSWRVLTKKT